MRASLGFHIGPLYIGTGNLLKKKRKRARYWTHGTCTVHHRTPEAAGRCKGTR